MFIQSFLYVDLELIHLLKPLKTIIDISLGNSIIFIRKTWFLIIGIIMIVIAISKGLPLAITGKMKNENNLVREMSACEIMSSAKNICADKTGTLTQNSMAVSSIYFEEQTNLYINPISYPG